MKILRGLDSFIDKFCSVTLVTSILLMLSISVLTIVLRWFNITILWLDPFVRHLVFLCSFLGGTLAIGAGNHIKIDILANIFESKKLDFWEQFTKLIVMLVSTLICVWLIKASVDFSKIEFEYGKEVFLGIKSGPIVSIIPFGFILMSYRFFYRFLEAVKSLVEKSWNS